MKRTSAAVNTFLKSTIAILLMEKGVKILPGTSIILVVLIVIPKLMIPKNIFIFMQKEPLSPARSYPTITEKNFGIHTSSPNNVVAKNVSPNDSNHNKTRPLVAASCYHKAIFWLRGIGAWCFTIRFFVYWFSSGGVVYLFSRTINGSSRFT